MVNVRNPFKRQDSVSGVAAPELNSSNSYDGKAPSLDSDDIAKTPYEEKESGLSYQPEIAADGEHKADYLHVAAKDIMANGKERPIEVSLFPSLLFLQPNIFLTSLLLLHLSRLLRISLLDACPSKTTPT